MAYISLNFMNSRDTRPDVALILHSCKNGRLIMCIDKVWREEYQENNNNNTKYSQNYIEMIKKIILNFRHMKRDISSPVT